MNISDHITLAEATKSQTATRLHISNEPTEEQLKNMIFLAEMIFEPLRELKNVPIAITSFFRSEELNSAIGGSSSSQHCKGEAMDIDADIFGTWTNGEIFNYIKDNLEYDQLIWEFGDDENPNWVHVSIKMDGSNKCMTLRAYKDHKRTKYMVI